MTIRVAVDGAIELQGICPSEDAEVLLQQLLAEPAAIIDWAGCDSAHTAVIQLLLVARRPLRGSPRGAALRDWIAPLLAARTP